MILGPTILYDLLQVYILTDFNSGTRGPADKVPCLHWWIPRLGLKLGETGKIPSKTEKVIIIFWGILCRGNIVITWSRCASNLPSLDLWLFPVSCSFLGRRLNQDQLQWGPSWKCRRGAYMLDTLGPRPLSISGRKNQFPFKICSSKS